ncbi:N-acylglucosamine-6-phosphate 2-epimerase [Planococcus donghaensis MPA1U2]|uniref:Putative N-acetylmannosamine-6-phosphate 2-epimerase n=1 Tax=Planococcus donghaensis MPA1U2 TaxID=933115 RepID=E7RCR3_9BACL|nr:N-acetylmannosamine-6-phosphate 2-epimerase [Planococcus donghaensis]EGA91428.1 N-acylglucosamine-6-phosphate 2-epimerase [Planococcus donghaensis MPA1U2]
MDKQSLLAKLKGGLVVSCQALDDEPLHSSYIMSRLAVAAQQGGAVGIRANSCKDISAIKELVDLPVIGIVKRDYEDSKVFITATLKEVEEVVKSGAEIVALDATNQLRPNGKSLDEFYAEIRHAFPEVLLMADISTFDEGVKASKLGFDLVATTLSGYTEYTKNTVLPNTELIKSLCEAIDTPVMAEGGYWRPEELEQAMAYGAHGCIVGSAITRPREITKRFVSSMNK